MFNIAERNLKIFFRQKSAVLFSLLGVIIIIVLYLVFLGNEWASDFELPEKEILMNNWIMAGIMAVASITTTMGAFGIMVEDRSRKNDKDFFAAPLKRSKIVGGYLLSAYAVGIIMTIVAFIIGEAYIAVNGGELLNPYQMLKILGIVLITVLMSSSMVFFIVSFFASNSAFMTASTILGTLIGFITGIYLPIGTLPENVQWVIKLFPVSHAGALLRQVMMDGPMQSSFAGIPESNLIEFKEMTGVVFTYGSMTATPAVHILVLVGTTVLFFLLAVWNVSKISKKNR